MRGRALGQSSGLPQDIDSLLGLAFLHQQMTQVLVRFGKAGCEAYGLSEVFLRLRDLTAFEQDRPQQGHHVDVIRVTLESCTAHGCGLVGPAGIDQRDSLAQDAF